MWNFQIILDTNNTSNNYCAQEEGLNEVSFLVDDDDPEKEDKLKSVLEELSNSCSRYVNFTKGVGCGQGLGKTKLDKERMKLCLREIVIYYNRTKL